MLNRHHPLQRQLPTWMTFSDNIPVNNCHFCPERKCLRAALGALSFLFPPDTPITRTPSSPEHAGKILGTWAVSRGPRGGLVGVRGAGEEGGALGIRLRDLLAHAH